MATPFGMDSLAEEAYGMTVFGGMVFDAMFSPFPEDYERLNFGDLCRILFMPSPIRSSLF